ncbi:hypothetical protein [Curtobacterium sp. Leaf261]|uniref:hypothetical protein n=1 Tax=Curtobacterium sp. Leaf261 TaxID=1736311 RepID=UPI00138F1F51|nr:hypothetical protein [Curtobacterium sp. Leaf261]
MTETYPVFSGAGAPNADFAVVTTDGVTLISGKVDPQGMWTGTSVEALAPGVYTGKVLQSSTTGPTETDFSFTVATR